MKTLNTQRGQSMVEYIVVLGALSAALLYVTYTTRGGETIPEGYIGSRESDQGSLVQAINQKHRGQGYALSLSEIPETDKFDELSAYYDRLEKYPELSNKLTEVKGKLDQVNRAIKNVDRVASQIQTYVPPSL